MVENEQERAVERFPQWVRALATQAFDLSSKSRTNGKTLAMDACTFGPRIGGSSGALTKDTPEQAGQAALQKKDELSGRWWVS